MAFLFYLSVPPRGEEVSNGRFRRRRVADKRFLVSDVS